MRKNKKVYIGNNVDIDETVIIKSNDIYIGDNSKILKGTYIHSPNKFYLGKNSYIGKNINIKCLEFICKENLYMCDGVEVGRGGCMGINSILHIGKHVGIFEGSMINVSEKVIIGDYTGMGGCYIWTHGAWLNVLDGYPFKFAPVEIGKKVWLSARSIILPGVKIGDNSVIGIGSVVNKDIPSGCLAAGTPCKVIKHNCFPKKLTSDEKFHIIMDIINNWKLMWDHKGIKNANVDYNENKITLIQDGINISIFNLVTNNLHGYINNVSEDLRDYLRRYGIKIYTDLPFKSIIPIVFR